MKKKVIATSAVLGLAALVLGGGTLAYFTDHDEITNRFTVGKVEIELIESQLHRANADDDSTSPLWTPGIDKKGDATNTSGVANQHITYNGTYFSDQQIIDDAANYNHENNGYFTINAKNILPGESVRKASYIINKGSVDTYVRTEYLIPKALFTIIDNAPSYWTDTAIDEGEVSSKHVDYYRANGKPSESMTEVIGDVEYYVFDFTNTDALNPGEITFWNPWGNIGISKDATQADFGRINNFDIIVRAKAVQASGFNSAEAAFAATFDK